MAYEFDYHIARCPTTREKREKLDIVQYKKHRKNIYSITKWLFHNRHKSFECNHPPELSERVPDSLLSAFDRYMMECIDAIEYTPTKPSETSYPIDKLIERPAKPCTMERYILRKNIHINSKPKKKSSNTILTNKQDEDDQTTQTDKKTTPNAMEDGEM